MILEQNHYDMYQRYYEDEIRDNKNVKRTRSYNHYLN